MANLSIKSKLLVMLLSVSLFSTVVIASLNYYATYQALQASEFSHLTSLRTARTAQIKQLLDRLVLETRANSQGVAVEAAKAFIGAFGQLRTAAVDPARDEALRQFYREQILPALSEDSGAKAELNSVYPETPVARYLQYEYIANNPFPFGEREGMIYAEDGSDYSRVHQKYHTRMSDLFLGLGFSNVILIDIDSGEVVYTARKYISFATSLTDGPYSHGNMADLFRALQRSPDRGRVEIADFQRHRARRGIPTAFIGTTLFSDGRPLAVLALELPADEIDRVMTGNQQWLHDGLGETGEVYLVGSDLLMRSNSRVLIENPQLFVEQELALKLPQAEIDRILRQNSTILNMKVDSFAAEQAIAGKEGTAEKVGYLGAETLASWSPLRVAGLEWGLVAKIDRDEVFAPLRAMARDMLIQALLILLLITLVVMVLAKSFVRPVNDLITRVQLARSGNTDITFPSEAGDEIGDLGRSFGELITVVRKQTRLLEDATAQNQLLLENVMPKAMAQRIRVGQGSISETIEDVSIVFAELRGLADYTQATSDNESVAALKRLTAAFDEAALKHGVERIKTVGDTYLAVTGLSLPLLDHMQRTAEFARSAREIVKSFNAEKHSQLGVTIGIGSGPVIADVTGRGQFLFQLWGAAVIAADHAMDCGETNDIIVTRTVRDGLADQYNFIPFEVAGSDVPLWKLVEGA
ncbi:MAG: adenylate/guanylate cyclase domain-containing protein [Pseudomonadales bacterium]|nr:adenylate/guanylate cyclase domain-containing protein [Halioglobus sp.]MCP5128781.1 adenylate/guanylate cyclase domain-containing protein [Pseudomonadales bacterium]